MAGKGFDLHAVIAITQVRGLQKAKRQIRDVLGKGALQPKLDVKISPQSRTRLQAINSDVQRINTSLKTTTQSFQQLSKGRPLTQVSTGMNKASRSAQNFGHSVKIAARRYSAFLVAMGGSVAIFHKVKMGFRDAIGFERETIKLAQIAKLTTSGMNTLADSVRNVGIQFGAVSSDLMEGVKTLAMAGFAANELKGSGGLIETLAKVSLSPTFGANLTSASDAIILMRSAFDIKEISDYEKYLSAINELSKRFPTESSEMVQMLKKGGSAMAGANNSIEQTLALMTALQSSTRETGSTLGNALKTISVRLQRVANLNVLRDVFDIEGIDASGQIKSTYEILEALSKVVKSRPKGDVEVASVLDKIFGLRQVGRLSSLLRNFDTANAAYNVSLKSTNSLSQDAATAQSALSVQIQKTKEKWASLFDTLVRDEGLRSTAQALLQMSGALANLAGTLKTITPLLTPALMMLLARGGMSVVGKLPALAMPAMLARGGGGGFRIGAMGEKIGMGAATAAKSPLISSGFGKAMGYGALIGGVGAAYGMAGTGESASGKATQAAMSGGLMGGLTGSMFGPVGMALGALVGSIYAAVKAYQTQTEQLAKLKLVNALSKISKSIGTEREGTTLQEARRKYKEEQKRIRDKASDLPGLGGITSIVGESMKDIMSGDSVWEKFKRARSYTYSALYTGGNYTAPFMEENIRRTGLAAETRTLQEQEQTSQQYVSAIVPFVNELIKSGDLQSIDSVKERFSMLERAMLQAGMGTDSLTESFGELIKETKRQRDEQAKQIQQSMKLGGVSGKLQQYARGLQTPSTLGPQQRFAGLDKIGTKRYGAALREMPIDTTVLQSLNKAVSILPDILTKPFTEGSYREQIIGDLKQAGVGDTVVEGVDSILSGIPFAEFANKMQDVNGLVAQLTGKFSTSVQAAQSIADRMRQIDARLAANLQTVFSARQSYFQSVGRVAGARAGLEQLKTGTPTRLGQLPSGFSNKSILQQVGMMAGTTDINEITKQLDGFRDMLKKTNDLRFQTMIQQSVAALEKLSNVSARLKTLNEEQARLASSRQGKLGFIQQYLTAGIQGKVEMQRNLAITKRFVGGQQSLEDVNPQIAKTVIETLKSLGSVQGLFGTKKTGSELLEGALEKVGGDWITENDKLKKLHEEEIRIATSAVAAMESLAEHQKNSFDTFIGQLGQANRDFLGGLGIVLGGGMQRGGVVSGNTNRVDAIPAMLSKNEFVVNRQATRRNFDLLQYINSGGKLKGFQQGGFLDPIAPTRVITRRRDPSQLQQERQNKRLAYLAEMERRRVSTRTASQLPEGFFNAPAPPPPPQIQQHAPQVRRRQPAPQQQKVMGGHKDAMVSLIPVLISHTRAIEEFVKIPTTFTHTHTHKPLQVIFNGAETLATIKPMMKNMIENSIRNAIARRIGLDGEINEAPA